MASGKKNSPEFKAKVGYEAAISSKQVLSELAKKYKVSEEEIIEWATKFGGVHTVGDAQAEDHTHGHDDHAAPEGIDFTIESADENLLVSVEDGIQDENLNYGKLGMWITIGIVTVISLVILAMQISDFYQFEKEMAAAGQTENLEVNRISAEQTEALNSFGVVDAENGVYSVPIDSAISLIVNQ